MDKKIVRFFYVINSIIIITCLFCPKTTEVSEHFTFLAPPVFSVRQPEVCHVTKVNSTSPRIVVTVSTKLFSPHGCLAFVSY